MTDDVDVIGIFKDMVRLDTTNPPGNERAIADYLGTIFRAHAIAYDIVEPEPTRASIVARIGPETGEPPVILISHLDVVAADPTEWDFPPFGAQEHDGVIYGRGTLDTKYLTAMELGAFLALKDAPLDRPVYFVATADEEQGSALGMPHVAEKWHKAFSGGVVVNEGGGFFIEHKGSRFHLCTAGEKGRCRFTVTLRGAGGPSSLPCDDPAVDKLMRLLDRMAAYRFAADDNPVATRFDELLGAEIDHPFLRAFSEYNRRDAFILKQYDAGTQANVVPNEIGFEAELHLVPARTRQYAEQVLAEVFEGQDADWEITDFRAGFVSNLAGDAYGSLRASTARHLEGAELLPVFALGQTDGRFLGSLSCDVFGFGPVTPDIPFSEVLTLVHQKNEKITRDSIVIGTTIIERLIRDIGQVAT